MLLPSPSRNFPTPPHVDDSAYATDYRAEEESGEYDESDLAVFLENPPTNHDQEGDAATSSPIREPVVAEVVTVALNNGSTSIGFKRPSLDEETAAMNAMLRLGAQDPSAARKRARLGRTKVCSYCPLLSIS